MSDDLQRKQVRANLGDELIVYAGVTPRDWQDSSGVEVVGKRVIVNDLHGNPVWTLEFRPLVKVIGDVQYIVYTLVDPDTNPC